MQNTETERCFSVFSFDPYWHERTYLVFNIHGVLLQDSMLTYTACFEIVYPIYIYDFFFDEQIY